MFNVISTGSSGTMCCLLCSNVLKMNTDIAVGGGTGLVDISCHHWSRFKKHTDETIWECADRVHACPANERKLLSQQLGIAYVPGSLIVNESLRRHAKPAACTMYDVAHVCFVNGVFQIEMQAFMDAAYRATEGTARPFSYSAK